MNEETKTRIEKAQQIAATIPCACSNCGMNEGKASQMIRDYATAEHTKAWNAALDAAKDKIVSKRKDTWNWNGDLLMELESLKIKE